MSEFTWTPEADSEVKGSVVLTEVSVEERLSFGIEMFGDLPEMTSEDNIKKVGAFTKSLSSGIKLLTKHVVKVDLVNKESGKKYTSINDLQGDMDVHGVLIDMATMYMERLQVGKILERLSKGKSQPTSEATG